MPTQQKIITVKSAIASGCCSCKVHELSHLLGVTEITPDDLVSQLLEMEGPDRDKWCGLVALYLPPLTNEQRITLAHNCTKYWDERIIDYLFSPEGLQYVETVRSRREILTQQMADDEAAENPTK